MENANDMGFIPEEDLIRQFWPDKVQPTTANPIVHSHNGTVDITCKTEGATIGYKFSPDHQPWTGWRIYKNPIQISEEQLIQVIAHRIGFAPSDTVTHRITE